MTKCKTQYKKTITIIIIIIKIIKIQDLTQVKEIKARVMEHKLLHKIKLNFLPLSSPSGHLSSSSIYPVCLAPYLIVTTCSDSRVRFWYCTVEGGGAEEEGAEQRDARAYRWAPWALLNDEEDSNSAVSVAGRPVAVACSYTGRLAVAFKQTRQVGGIILCSFF